jgi:hypothetical protein
MNRTGVGSPYSKQEKSDSPVSGTGLSGFVETGGSQGHHQVATRSSSYGQATSGLEKLEP